jgi:LytS/YehU family sensor histidine kinase
LGWGTFVLANLVIAALFGAITPGSVASFMLTGVLGMAFTHGYRGFVRRRGWIRLSLLHLIPRILLSAIAMGALLTGVLSLASLFVFRTFEASSYQPSVAVTLVFNLSITFLGWALIYFGLHYFWNYKQAEVERWRLEAVLREAELKALKSQLNPHFLFNSLNSLRALILEDPPRAQEAVTQLAGLLRYALQAGHTTVVPLSKEVETVRVYLELDQVRLEERLRYRIDVDAAAYDVPVPTLLVQTLVENAVKHGIGAQPEGGELQVTARLGGDGLRLNVVNTGRLGTAVTGTGVGLRNARERLGLLYGDAAALTVADTPGGTVTATLTIDARHRDGHTLHPSSTQPAYDA